MSSDELYEKYHNKLPVFYIENSSVDYVALEKIIDKEKE